MSYEETPNNLSLKGIVEWAHDFNFIESGETLPDIVPQKGVWFIVWSQGIPAFYISDGANWVGVQSSGLADNSVTTQKIVAKAVTTEKLDNNAVTNDKLALNSVKTNNIVDKAINNDKLADDSVANSNIINLSITSDKLAGGSVTTNKMTNSAVITNKIADKAITTEKLNDNAITTEKINNGSVTNNKIADDSINTDKIIDKSVTSAKLADNLDIHTNSINASECPIFTCGEPSTLIGGNYYTDGYFGEVDGANLIYPWELLTQLKGGDLSVINSKQAFIDNFTSLYGSTISYQFSGTGYEDFNDNLECSWLKFFSYGKIIFIAKRPLLNSISWNDIIQMIPNNKDGIDIQVSLSRINANYTGNNVILKCKLLSGGNNYPFVYGLINDRGKEGVKLGQGSEWNRLMYRISRQIPTDINAGIENGYSGGAQVGNNWTEMTDNELGFGGNDTIGRVNICKEYISTNAIVARGGGNGIGAITDISRTNNGNAYAFRPCLVFDPTN